MPRSDDVENFIANHIRKLFRHPVADDSQFKSSKQRAKRMADYDADNEEDEEVYESKSIDEEMTERQMKKREEIVKAMKKDGGMKKMKERYGDKAKDVMYATATKQAMKENRDLGVTINLNDGKKIRMTAFEHKVLSELLSDSTKAEKKDFMERLHTSMEEFKDVLDFAKEL